MIIRVLVLCGLLSLSAPALALSCSATVTGSGISFGSVNTLSTANPLSSASSNITITCTRALLEAGGNATACIYMGDGLSGANSSVRFMKSGSNILTYNLFKDAAGTMIWGSSSGSFISAGPKNYVLNVPGGVLGGSATINDTIYGRVTGNQSTVIPGTYSSSLSGPATGVRFANGTVTCANTGASMTSVSMNVGATVPTNCLITAQNLNFGSTTSLVTNLDANSAISVQCTNTTPYSLTINNGANFSGTRRMRDLAGTSFINYVLFQDAARSIPWGTSNGSGTGSNLNITVFGRVPPQPTNTPGNYTDTVASVITF
jgi:spore coat protein U-like protein